MAALNTLSERSPRYARRFKKIRANILREDRRTFVEYYVEQGMLDLCAENLRKILSQNYNMY